MQKTILKFRTTGRGTNEYSYEDHIWDVSSQLKINDLLKMKEFSDYKLCATIEKSNNTAGYIIKPTTEFINKPFIVYILTWNYFVLKGGKSKNSLNQRSYGAGTEKNWTENGTPSGTNYVWSQIFRKSVEDGDIVEFYGIQVESNEMPYYSHGKTKSILVSPYEEVEKDLNFLLNKLNGKKVIGEGKLLEKYKN